MELIHSLRSGWWACFLRLLILPLWVLSLAPVGALKVNQTNDVASLVHLITLNDIGGYPVMTWNGSDRNPCAWIGVTCTIHDTVEELDLSGWGASFDYLAPLTALKDLRRLDLSSNNVAEIEILSNMTQLIWLDVSGTLLNFLPTELFDGFGFKNLRYLDLQQSFPGGPWKLSDISNLRELVNLQFLNLAGNQLSGTFSTEGLGGLSSLVTIDLSRNALSGLIPSLPNLTRLVELKLDGNNFTGFEEHWFLGTHRLQYLSISNNQLEGKIPSNIADFGNLLILNMSGNYLSDTIPSEIFMAKNGGFSLDLSHNRLTGGIPPDVLLHGTPLNGTCGSLNLSYNQLTGNLPIASERVCFSALNFADNNLSGTIPANIFTNYTVTYLSLGNNKLSGDIVDGLFNGLANIGEARLQNNLFTGDLSRIANLTWFEAGSGLHLYVLDLSNNLLQWSVSKAVPDPMKATLEVFSPYQILREFWVGGNNFSGTSLPTASFVNSTYTSALSVLDLSNSQLDGEIVGSAFDITSLPYLKLLNLSNNHANGPLPDSIVAARPLSAGFIVDVSNNNLTGVLPDIPQSSSLYNGKYFVGNAGLCGAFLPPCPVALPQKQGTGVQWWVLLVAIGGSVLIATGSCLAVTWRWRTYHKKHQQDADLIKTLLERESATLMPLRDLKKATENFAESAQIGEGGFGIVYIGKLDNGTTVAVKRSKQEGSVKDKEQFLNEVRILSQIKHRNLVKLLGCCMENKIAVLVFEFISNGTLQEHLQGKFGEVRLSWKQRLNIAIQTADALNYLHSTTIFPIYHRDVKSANILLDDNLNAKVADFGISKLAPLRATHVSTVAVQGTIGYIDPEYYTSYQLTDKSDVYSFGVVLLELISAMPALDFCRGGDETSLVYFAGPYIVKGELLGLIDPTLVDTYSDQVKQGKESILTVGKLAMKCLEMRSKARPNMYEVLKELEKLWLDLDGTSNHTNFPTVENDNDDVQRDLNGVLFDTLFQESFCTDSDASGIQLSQLSNARELKIENFREAVIMNSSRSR